MFLISRSFFSTENFDYDCRIGYYFDVKAIFDIRGKGVKLIICFMYVFEGSRKYL